MINTLPHVRFTGDTTQAAMAKVVHSRIQHVEQQASSQMEAIHTLKTAADTLLLQGVQFQRQQQTRYQERKAQLDATLANPQTGFLTGLWTRAQRLFLSEPHPTKIFLEPLDPNASEHQIGDGGQTGNLLYYPPAYIQKPLRLLEEAGFIQVHISPAGYRKPEIPYAFSLTENGKAYVQELEAQQTA